MSEIFKGYDEFVLADGMTLDVDLPTQVKIVDTKKMVRVNLKSMQITGDADSRDLNLEDKGKNFTPATFQLFAYAMLDALNGRRKVSTVLRWINELSLFAATISQLIHGKRITSIVQSMYNAYAADKSSSQVKLLRSALKYWFELDIPGIHPDLGSFLQTSRSPKPRSTTEIQNTTPTERPLTVAQVRTLLTDVDTLYMTGKFNPQDNLLWRLIISEAMRPSQMELLRCGDVTVNRDPREKVTGATVMVPIVKQKGTPARDYMIEYDVSVPVARALAEHLVFLAKCLGRSPPSDLALFCFTPSIQPTKLVSAQPLGITHYIITTRTKLASMSDELVDCDLFTRRFKHTKLTHLAMLGASLDVLARAGFQTSTVSLRRYVNLTDEAYVTYEKAMSAEHDFLLAALKPSVIPKQQATNPSPENRIMDSEMDKELGSCAASWL